MLRCPYCGSPLDDGDETHDREALRCADCGERVEFVDAEEEEKEEWYLIFNGGLSTMEIIAKRGVRVLNVNTWRWQVLSKTAQYRVVETDRFIGSDGQEHVLANLMCNENLRRVVGAREGLII